MANTPQQVALADQRGALQAELVAGRRARSDEDYAAWIMPRLGALRPRELTVLAARLIDELAQQGDR